MGYVHIEIVRPLLLYYPTKNEWIQPTSNLLQFLFTLSQYLSHNHKDCFTMLQYNTKQNHITMPSFYKWNTMGKYHGKISWVSQIPWAHKSPIMDQVVTLKLQHFTRNFFLNVCYGGASPKPSLGGGSQICHHPR